MDTTHTATAAATYVAIQHDRINLSLYRVTPLEDGLELVEWIGGPAVNTGTGGHPDYAEAIALVDHARTMATVTGSRSATHREERRQLDGELVVTGEATYYSNRWAAPRIALGVHRARLTLDPAQAELKARAASNPAEPAVGDRYIVSTLSGYKLAQDRSYDHRDCSCGDGVTTYAEGTVTAVTPYMDNSVEATVTLDEGGTRTITLVASEPRGGPAQGRQGRARRPRPRRPRRRHRGPLPRQARQPRHRRRVPRHSPHRPLVSPPNAASTANRKAPP